MGYQCSCSGHFKGSPMCSSTGDSDPKHTWVASAVDLVTARVHDVCAATLQHIVDWPGSLGMRQCTLVFSAGW